MEQNSAAIQREIDRVLPRVVSVRQHLHGHPELALREHGTSRFLREQLAGCGIRLLPPFLETDVVAMIDGSREGGNVTLRADMDALPIQEMTELPYASAHEGMMHACGHDGHSAMLLGAALVLEQIKQSFCGSVRCVFQPGEENVAAGRDLVAAGVLNEPQPDAVLALHAWPGPPLGSIGARPGIMMAACDLFTITIKGRGGHGSRPERSVDPIHLATRVIGSLYDIPSRRIGALDPVVISVCSIHGGSTCNVIPEEVVIKGSVRYLSQEAGDLLPGLCEQAVKAQCEAVGAGYHIGYQRPYLPTVNDARVVEVCREVVREGFSAAAWVDVPHPSMGAEDFSYYTQSYPGAIFFLGMGEESPQLHSNRFNFNDSALRAGIQFLVLSTLKLLEERPK